MVTALFTYETQNEMRIFGLSLVLNGQISFGIFAYNLSFIIPVNVKKIPIASTGTI